MASASLKASAQTRTVEVGDFRVRETKVYDITQNLVLCSETATNPTNTPKEVTINFKYIDATTSCWKHDIVQPPAVKTTFTSRRPLLTSTTSFDMKPVASYETEWGKPITIKEVKPISHKITVPPKSKVTVTLLADKAHIDLPFSYTQTDKDANGEIIDTFVGDDGLFTGVNYYGLQFKEENLLPLP